MGKIACVKINQHWFNQGKDYSFSYFGSITEAWRENCDFGWSEENIRRSIKSDGKLKISGDYFLSLERFNEKYPNIEETLKNNREIYRRWQEEEAEKSKGKVGVYILFNRIEKKVYVGHSTELNKRKKLFFNFKCKSYAGKKSLIDEVRLKYPNEKSWAYRVLPESHRASIHPYGLTKLELETIKKIERMGYETYNLVGSEKYDVKNHKIKE